MFRILTTLINKQTNNLTIALDDNQNIYKHQHSWKDVGVQVRGRVHKITYVYRNTKEICNFASTFIKKTVEKFWEDVLTTITTVPANGIKYITKIICSGEENAKWDIFINSVRKMTKRTTDRTVDFDFSTPLKLAASSVLDVKVTHHGPDSTATFSASVNGYQPT